MELWVEILFALSASILAMVSILLAYLSHARQQKRDFNDSLNRMSSAVYKEWARLYEKYENDMPKVNQSYLPGLTNKIWASTIVCLPIVQFQSKPDGGWTFTKVTYFKNPFTRRKKNIKLAELFTQFDKSVAILIDNKNANYIELGFTNGIIKDFCIVFAQISNQVKDKITLVEIQRFSLKVQKTIDMKKHEK